MSRLDNCLTAIVGDKLPIETARKTFFFLLGIAVMLIVIALPSPSPFYKGEEAIPLTANAKIVMAVLCFAVIQWMTEAIPFPATSLCLIVFLHILGVASFDKLVTLGFGNNVLLFLMGAMGLSAAMTSSGLARRFMLWMLTKVGRRTDRIVLAFIAIGTMTSMWVTDMAVAAMLLPLGVSILESSGCKPLQSNFGRALMIGIVWGALIGGTAARRLRPQRARHAVRPRHGSYGCFLCPVDGGGRPRRHDHGPPRLVLPHEAVPAGIP